MNKNKLLLNAVILLITISFTTLKGTTYYLKSTGAITSVASWGPNTDGSGTSPLTFNGNTNVWNVYNQTNITLTSTWGLPNNPGVTVNFGDGITALDFILGAGGQIGSGASLTKNINNKCRFTWTSGTFFWTNVTLTTGSTFVYNQAIAVDPSVNYSNLEINANVNLGGQVVTVNGILTLNSGVVFTLDGAGALILNGTIAGSGTFGDTGSGSNITLNSSGTIGTLLMDATNNTLSSLVLNNATGVLTLGSALNIADSVSVLHGTLNTGGNLTIKATPSLKGRVSRVGGTISGNVTVETLIPAGATGWSMLGVAGVNSQHISDWDKYPTDPNGLPMTCIGCTYEPSVAGNFYSIQGWDETANDYDTLMTNINSGTALTPGKGFWVYAGNGATTSTDIKLSNTGGLVTGPLSIAVSDNSSGYNLVANPYASPVSWDNLYALVGANNGNVSPTIYTYGDNGNSSFIANGVGGSGTNDLVNGILPAGQGFYVQALSPSTVDFDEIGKSDANTIGIFKPAASSDQKFRLKITGAVDHDDELFRFIPNATPFFDIKYDAHKLFTTPGYVGYPGSYDKYTTISSKDAFDVDYSIHSMPPLTQSLTIPVLARVSAAGSYTISAYDFKNFTSCIGLMDKATNTFHDLRQSDYVFTINDSTAVPRFDLMLCKDESIDETGISQIYSQSPSILINQDEQSPFVKMAFPQNTKATISVYNIMGQKLMDDVTVQGTATTTRLNTDLHNQVVLIRVVTDKESSTKKMVIH